ncbi:Major allergen Alt a 1 [Lasiodiplodia hormozganensis]|uniref:Major allergen Alt a 1 n=1 Tax=Lasiodiplodia hormozganensis TaxID=869390 RepID=A0AA40CK13_9PEZI|nr:Major allergen Alt a 1 [Lasiodiplodia hormozganensis]
MKFLTAAAATALLSATTALAAPTDPSYSPPPTYSCPGPDKETTKYQIKEFSTRKYDGKKISTLSFRILATNGGTLDFQCIPYDPVTKGATQAFEDGKVYFCGENTFFSFSFTAGNGADKKNELFLWQEVSENNTIGGKADFDDPICHAGGSSINDLVCTVPDQVYLSVTLEKLGA